MNTAPIQTTTSVSVTAFTDARRAVARAFWWILTSVGIPTLVWALVEGNMPREQSVWVWSTLAAVLFGSLGAPLARRHSDTGEQYVLLASLWGVVFFSLLANGNGFGAGVIYLAWTLAMVFFEASWLVTTILGSMAIGVVLAAVRFGWVSAIWASRAPDSMPLLRLIIMLLAVTGAATWMFSLVLTRLRETIEAEANARQRELAAHAEREAALESAQRGQQLESLGRLSGGVAHDVNNALAVLSMGLETLDESLPPEERRDVVESMRQALRGAESTTRQLLAFSRQGTRIDGTVRPAQLLEGMSRTLTRLFPETIRFALDIADTPAVPLSAGELEQVLLNLCLNARDAMPRGGVITLRTSVVADSPLPVCVEVCDTGQGMTPDVLARAFDPFFTTKEAARGTGLGLSMVHGVIMRPGGRVEIDSTPSHGTTVRLLLPAVEQSAALPAVASLPARTERKSHILVVEDEEALARMLARTLSTAGYQVSVAHTIGQAEALLHSVAHFDMLLTDAVLPDGGPWQLITQFRSGEVRRPVLVCSGYIPEPAILQEIEAEECAFLPKPFGVRQVVQSVETLLSNTRIPLPAFPRA